LFSKLINHLNCLKKDEIPKDQSRYRGQQLRNLKFVVYQAKKQQKKVSKNLQENFLFQSPTPVAMSQEAVVDPPSDILKIH